MKPKNLGLKSYVTIIFLIYINKYETRSIIYQFVSKCLVKKQKLKYIFVILTFEIRSIFLKVNLYCPTVFKFQQLDKKVNKLVKQSHLKDYYKKIDQSLQQTPII